MRASLPPDPLDVPAPAALLERALQDAYRQLGALEQTVAAACADLATCRRRIAQLERELFELGPR